MCRGVYTPALNKHLVEKLYHLAAAKGVPMTKLLNELVEEALRDVRIVIHREPKQAQ